MICDESFYKLATGVDVATAPKSVMYIEISDYKQMISNRWSESGKHISKNWERASREYTLIHIYTDNVFLLTVDSGGASDCLYFVKTRQGYSLLGQGVFN